MMAIKCTNGFTLIELLIVVAIISLFAASSISVIVVPMQEQPLASLDHEFETGASTFAARVIEDAHSARGLKVDAESRLTFDMGTTTITYLLDEQKNLRRILTDAASTITVTKAQQGSSLLGQVETFRASPSGVRDTWKIELKAGTERYQRRSGINRNITIAVGTASWSEGAH